MRYQILGTTQLTERRLSVVVDTTEQNDSATISSIDVNTEIKVTTNLKSVSAFCILIQDHIVEYLPLIRSSRKRV